jgi:hypothetical protein
MISFSSSSGIATSSSDRTVNSSNSGAFASRYRPSMNVNNTQTTLNSNVSFNLISQKVFQTIEARPHSLPYQSWVEIDPSFDQMRQLVCVQQKRPELDEEWTNGSNVNSIL